MKPKYIRNPAAKTFSLSEVRHGVWWDSIDLDDRLLHSQRTFGNANIGYLNRANMQMGGQLLLSDGFAAILQRWFARTNVVDDAERSAVAAWAGDTVATFVHRSRITWQLHMSELFARRPNNDPDRVDSRRKHDPWPCVIGSRDSMYVSVDMFEQSRDRVVNQFHVRRPDQARPAVSVVFEGLVVPEPLVDTVLSILMTLRERRVAAHVEIVEYILGVADKADPEEAAILRVIADGVLEHKALL